MALQEEQDRDGRSYSLEDLESPFLREELFGGETGAEWEARLAALEAESPFLREFLPGAAAVDPFPLQYSLGDAAASSREADRRFKRVAALVTDGLKVAKDAIPQLSANGQQELLRFMASLLENFFPRGHGLIDAQAKVRRQSKIGTVAVPVIAKDGSRWPFEHRVRLYLSDQIGFRKSGEHLTGNFSSIRLFTRELHEATPSRAVLVALHEMTHMMFAMIGRFEHQFGAETAARLLSRQPWRLLVLSGFAAHRERLERHVRDLLRVLPIPMQTAELAASLVEEAFAAMLEVIVDEAIARSSHAKKGKRGPAILPTYDFSPKNSSGTTCSNVVSP